MYKYYVFISYSRLDSKPAGYLHRQLEHIPIPVKLVPPASRPGNSKYLRPVFRDKRDLKNTEHSFTKDIELALKESRYLLVLCSPNSAVSPWVHKEIRQFLDTHDGDTAKIVPVILRGEPEECLPEAIRTPEILDRNLPSMIPDDGESEKAGWEDGIVQALSYMLNVDREKIKANVDREKLRQAKIYAAVGICAATVFAALTGWAIHAERIADRNEKLAQKNAALAREKALQAKTNEERAVAEEKRAKENEAKAKEQAEIARKSTHFLCDMFRSSDPTMAGSREMRILDAIKAKLPDIPKIRQWQFRASISREIALILNNIGETETALPLAEDALKLFEAHDPGGPETSASYDALGQICSNMGDFDKALRYLTKALDIRSKTVGENHFTTADSYSNLGQVYEKQGKYREALDLYRKALAIQLAVFGENHRKTAYSYNNIGFAYFELGDSENALKYLNKALEIRLRLLGENHLDTANSYNNIGIVCRRNDEKLALHFHQKALAIRKKMLGEDHPATARSYSNIGNVYYYGRQYEKALEYHQKALKIRSAALGKDHPDVAASYHNIGLVCSGMREYEKAAAFFDKALQIRRQKIGSNHSLIAEPMFQTAVANWRAGKKEAAVEYAEKALAIAEKGMGKDHPQTQRYRDWLTRRENK